MYALYQPTLATNLNYTVCTAPTHIVLWMRVVIQEPETFDNINAD